MLRKNSVILIGLLGLLTACSARESNMKLPIRTNISKSTVINLRSYHVGIMKDLVNSIDLKTKLPVTVRTSYSAEAEVVGTIAILKPESKSEDQMLTIIESITFTDKVATFVEEQSKIPICDNRKMKLIFRTSSPPKEVKSIKRVTLDRVDIEKTPICLARIEFRIPKNYPIVIRQYNRLLYDGRLNREKLAGQLKRATTIEQKLSLATGYLNNVAEEDRADELLDVLFLLDQEVSRYRLLLNTIPRTIVLNYDNMVGALYAFRYKHSSFYKDSLVHILKHSEDPVDFEDVRSFIHPLAAYQQIDILNVLLARDKVNNFQSPTSFNELLKAFLSSHKRMTALQRVVDLVDFRVYNHHHLIQTTSLFSEDKHIEVIQLISAAMRRQRSLLHPEQDILTPR